VGQTENPFDGLRMQALHATAELAGFDPSTSGRFVYGGIMDWTLESGLATLFTLEDGTASLYLSSGGGVIGGGFHQPVREAARVFLLSFEPHVASMSADPTGEPPEYGMTDLRALTPQGRLVMRAPTQELGRGRHPMSDTFHAGQGLIAALRAIASERDQPKSR